MSLLSNTYIKNLFNTVFSNIYEDGQLIRTLIERDESTGSIRPIKQEPFAVKVQIDECTEAMREQQGYSDEDVRLIMLCADMTGERPKNGDLIITDGGQWKIGSVHEDPAHTYFDIRAVNCRN